MLGGAVGTYPPQAQCVAQRSILTKRVPNNYPINRFLNTVDEGGSAGRFLSIVRADACAKVITFIHASDHIMCKLSIHLVVVAAIIKFLTPARVIYTLIRPRLASRGRIVSVNFSSTYYLIPSVEEKHNSILIVCVCVKIL